MANYLSYAYTNPTYQSYITEVSDLKETKHFIEASKDEKWIQTMNLEIHALESNRT